MSATWTSNGRDLNKLSTIQVHLRNYKLGAAQVCSPYLQGPLTPAKEPMLINLFEIQLSRP